MRTLEHIFRLYRDAVDIRDAGEGFDFDCTTADGKRTTLREGADAEPFWRADLSQWVEDWGKVERVDISGAVCGLDRLAGVWRICYEALTPNVFVDGKAPAVFWIGWITQRHFKHLGGEKWEIDNGDAEAVNALIDDFFTVSTLLESKDRASFKTIFKNAGLFKPLNLTDEMLSKREEQRDKDKADRIAQQRAARLIEDISERLGDPAPKVSEIFTFATESLERINRERLRFSTPAPDDWETIRQAIADAPPALETGFDALPPLVSGAVTLVAGRPGRGKTTLMLNILRSLAESEKSKDKQLLFFTYEEGKERLYLKLLCSLINKDLSSYGASLGGFPFSGSFNFLEHYFKGSNLVWTTPQARDQVASWVEQGESRLAELMRDGHVQIIESPPTAENFKAHLSNFRERGEIGAVFVDYVQRMRSENPSTTQRDTVNTASRELVASAVEFGCPFIVGAQFNREAGKQGRETLAHDLKESGNLEEDANTIIGVINISREVRERSEENSRDINSPHDQYMADIEDRHDLLEVKTLKSRDGQPKKGELIFSNRFWRVDDFDSRSDYSDWQTVRDALDSIREDYKNRK
jgi:replicative DNA helicase